MTCIVGITNGATIFVGGERAISDGSSILSAVSPKVEIRDNWIYGYAGTIGIGQLLSLIPLTPADEVENIYHYIKLDMVEQLKKAIESFANITNDHDTSWLIGGQGRLFEVNSADWGVVEVYESAIGSGSEIALGSLYTSLSIVQDTEERIRLALHSAITYSPNCQGPTDILRLDLI